MNAIKLIFRFLLYSASFCLGFVVSVPTTLHATGMPLQIQTFKNGEIVDVKTWIHFKKSYYPIAGGEFPAIVLTFEK